MQKPRTEVHPMFVFVALVTGAVAIVLASVRLGEWLSW